MGLNLARKIIGEHLLDGEMRPGEEIALRIDQTLTYDTLGPMTMMAFEAMAVPRVRTKLSVCYIDHNVIQPGYESADDHQFLRTMAAKYGLLYSRPGNGICHQVHLERFSAPGDILLGTDSHTPTAGGLGTLGIGAGGTDVAVAMAGGPAYIRMPRIVRVLLTGKLSPWVASKDLILQMLQRLRSRGGVDSIFEYAGEGVASLSVPERATVCNMSAELGATSSIFPSDENTLRYMRAQQREAGWRPLAADPGAEYDDTIEVDLSTIEPLVSTPGSPDNVVPVSAVEGTKVHQVIVGSCTNSSYADLMTTAAVLRGRAVHPEVSMSITPGSRQVMQMISRSGALGDLIDSGARILESTCGPCTGMGQAPGSDQVSLRTFNRNYPGRSGTYNDRVYLCSPQVAAASAVAGEITDPRRLGDPPAFELPEQYAVDDRMIVPPAEDTGSVEIFRGPNIKPLPIPEVPPEALRGRVILKAGDSITTDLITPGTAKTVPLRANVPALAEYAFEPADPDFPRRAREMGGGFVVAGHNYGQGSSMEQAAIVPMYLGVRAVLAKSFARIHSLNLINAAVLPLTFIDESDYDRIEQGDELEIPGLREAVAAGDEVLVRNLTRGLDIRARHAMTPRLVQVYLDGGMLNHIRGLGVRGSGLGPGLERNGPAG
jgi:aconitate hydratase